MAEARPVHPIDLLALVSYKGSSYPNEAWTRERLTSPDSGAFSLGAALEQFLAFTRGRSAWISARRGRLQGLVGARRRGGRQAWEVDCLVDATRDQRALGGLLACCLGDLGRNGAEKLFLRLDAASPLLPAVRDAGFFAYRRETLYVRSAASGAAETPPLRPLAPSDSYHLYRLYNTTVPEPIRRFEAATYAEWQAAQERRWLRGGVQLVIESGQHVEAVVSAARAGQAVQVALLTQAGAGDRAVAAIAAAVAAVEGAGLPVFLLAAEEASLDGPLQAAGFSPRRDFVSLARRTTRTVGLPKLIPAVAKTAIGV